MYKSIIGLIFDELIMYISFSSPLDYNKRDYLYERTYLYSSFYLWVCKFISRDVYIARVLLDVNFTRVYIRFLVIG